MHTRLLFLFVLLYCIESHAQKKKPYAYKDSLFMNNGEILVGRIIFFGEDSVFYNFYLPDSTIKEGVVARAEVQRTGLSARRNEIIEDDIKHINGLSGPLNEKYKLKGKKDAEKYYDDYTSAGTGTLVVALLSPLVGLIPAIATSSTMPKDKNLKYPSSKLMENPDYRNGYMRRAKKIKQGRVWTNWGIALGVNFLVAILLSHPANSQ